MLRGVAGQLERQPGASRRLDQDVDALLHGEPAGVAHVAATRRVVDTGRGQRQGRGNQRRPVLGHPRLLHQPPATEL